MRRSTLLIGILCLLVPFVFWGCSGDDGATGATGATGPPGPPGADLTAAPQPESCNVCHGLGQIRDVTVVHAVRGVPSVGSVQTAQQADNTLTITFNVKVDGVNNDTYFNPANDNISGYVNIDNAALPDTHITKFERLNVTGRIASSGGGNYTITVPDNAVFDNATYLFRLVDTATSPVSSFTGAPVRPVVIANHNGNHLRDLVTSGTAANPAGCASCHGPYPAYSKNFNHYAVGGSECQICHSRSSRTSEARTKNPDGTFDNLITGRGANLTEYVHGIHNSHNMVGGIYYRSGANDAEATVEDRYSVGYPSDMRNCNVCHDSQAQRERIASAPVSYYLCMTCHVNWDGFRHVHDGTNDPPEFEAGDPIFAANDFHRTLTPAANCMACHIELVEKNEASDFHNDFQATDAHYDSFYRGEDISFNNADNVLFAITGVQKSGDNVSFTWTATKNGVAVNPCNDNLSNGPTFLSLGAYLGYAKGDDWVNENVSASQAPGQPLGARNLFSGNNSLSTTCANNVATTTGLTVAAGANAYAKKAVLAIGGKPLNRGTFTIGAASVQRDYFVRVPSPTHVFSMTDGSAAAARRPAVDTNKCNRCHRGTLYQHGGDRVDNEQLCAICHNPSASEKNVRANTYRILNADNTVNTGATYDGKVAETYDMRYLIHAVHGAEKREKPIVIYRGRGIFAFAPPVYVLNAEGDRQSVPHPRPTGWPADETTKQPIFGSLNDNTQVHTWTTIHYPKPFNECLACHTGTEYFDPADQTKAVAVTVDPGTSYPDQSDDIVIGPSAAACTGCHESTGPDGIPVQRHVTFDFGYKANVAKEVMLEKAAAIALSVVLPAP